MSGIIIIPDNYTYEGHIVGSDPHGKGTFQYANGDKYIGECKYGKADGFGTYLYFNGLKYTGFFSYGKFHGVGTYEDEDTIYKGHWRNDKKHGTFLVTNKVTYKTYNQLWIMNKLKSSTECQYMQPAALETVKQNPLHQCKKLQVKYKCVEKKCIACLERGCNAVNVSCGHVAMCYECLIKCQKCPICRCPISNVLKLYIS
jgi:hypothetical protein